MKRSSIVLAAVVLAAGIAAPSLLAAVDVPLHNWPVPTSQRGGARTQGTLGTLGTLTDVRSPSTFVPMAPCRVVDTRNAIGTFGGPIMTGGAPARTFPITSGPCTGIAANPSAYSLNFTVVDMAAGDGFLTAFPTGTTQPVVSTLDYKQIVGAIANAAIVPAGSGNSINVFVNVTTNLIIDINGYFIDGSSSINPNEFYGFNGAGTGVLGLVFSNNTSTSTNQGTSAFRGFMTGAGNAGAAVLGDMVAASGANFGVRGNNSSTSANSAGVLGVAGTRTTTLSYRRAGVRGESASDLGVLGIINTSSAGVATAGESLTGTTRDFAGYLGNASASLGVQYIGGLGGSGTKNFYEPHPTDPDKVIRYVSLEGPEAGTYFRGRGVLVHGQAVIDVPESFRMVTDAEGLTAQVTVMGRPTAIAVSSLDLNQVVVEGSRDVEFSYLVQGVRKAYKDFQVVAKHSFFQPRFPGDLMPSSLSPDEKARLVANGTYNADGSVNMGTAERLGWAQQWRDRERQDQERAAAEAAERAGKPPNQP